jgi:hypothetical protein
VGDGEFGAEEVNEGGTGAGAAEGVKFGVGFEGLLAVADPGEDIVAELPGGEEFAVLGSQAPGEVVTAEEALFGGEMIAAGDEVLAFDDVFGEGDGASGRRRGRIPFEEKGR